MSDFTDLDRRPLLIAIAGPNGAGKTTFFESHLAQLGLRFVNADALADEMALDPYEAARVAESIRSALLARRESFAFETVLSDPVGDKIAFLEEAARQGYTVVLFYIGVADAKQSEERVAIRVAQGGHDVPTGKIRARFPRTLANLRAGVSRLPHVLVYDNSDLRRPFRHVATFDHGRQAYLSRRIPAWLKRCTPD
jgi:predicted ABC-type ATPase